MIVGSGFGGLGMAIQLARRGERDFVVLERADSIGGTWRANRYPGCSCDVPSHLYSFSFAPNPGWSRRYSPQAEIQAYLDACADRFGVRDQLRFGTRMTAAEWDHDACLWRVTVNRSETLTTRFLITATGALSKPGRPSVKGLEGFSGRAFHSADWPGDFDPAGLRIGIAGTGASAAQIVPALAGLAGRLTVFQRTPAWVLPRRDRAYSGLERTLFGAVPGLTNVYRARDRVVFDSRLPVFKRPRMTEIAERYARRHLRRQVADPRLRESLTPEYRIGCKRAVLSDDYLAAFNRPDVELVPAALTELHRSTARAADGQQRELDALVFATGFEIGAALVGSPIRGRDGADLLRTWAGEGASAHRGTTVAGFPNLFVLSGPNLGLGHSSILLMTEAQIEHVLAAVDELRRRGATAIEPRAEAQRAYNDELQSRLADTVWNLGGCQSWYLDRNGRNTSIWPDSPAAFRRQSKRLEAAEFSFSTIA